MHKQYKKIHMWYKVRELNDAGLNNSQISRETGLDRGTVQKYLTMTEDGFHEWISQTRHLPKKLAIYLPFVKKQLEQSPYLSAAQIEDRLKEHFADLPNVHSKTVYNMVQSVREKYSINKPTTDHHRDFEQLPETAYGHEAQVDFGETWLQTDKNKRIKVYFFAMVLSRSRYKYIYLTNKAFISSVAVECHDKAFDYFQGIPRKIIYDQDKVFIHNENLGDYLLSGEFKSYSKSQDFDVIFCRKADPQSKGKIENVVKYVKYNFLRGRIFTTIENLNIQAIEWLARTGNKKVHSTIQKIPHQEWQIEQKYLLPLKSDRSKATVAIKSYNVRKDNTINYRSNFYSLPLGIYKNAKSVVGVEAKGGILNIYSASQELICAHKISQEKGQSIRNTDHRREKSQSIETYKKQAISIFGNSAIGIEFIDLLQQDKARYLRDNLQVIVQKINNISPEILQESLLFCIENKQFNAYKLIEVIDKKKAINQAQSAIVPLIKELQRPFHTESAPTDIWVERSNIDVYEELF